MQQFSMDKILKFENLEKTIKKVKSQGSITLVGGCFDILHSGHIEFLSRAQVLGGQVVVMLESDESVKKRKGSARPVNTQQKRALKLCALSSVDYVLPIPNLTSDREYTRLVKTLEPDIIAVTCGDPILKIKENQAKMVGGKVVEVMDRDKRFSTSKAIKQMIDIR